MVSTSGRSSSMGKILDPPAAGDSSISARHPVGSSELCRAKLTADRQRPASQPRHPPPSLPPLSLHRVPRHTRRAAHPFHPNPVRCTAACGQTRAGPLPRTSGRKTSSTITVRTASGTAGTPRVTYSLRNSAVGAEATRGCSARARPRRGPLPGRVRRVRPARHPSHSRLVLGGRKTT